MNNVATITYSNAHAIGDALYQITDYKNVLSLRCVRHEFPDGEKTTEVKRRGDLELPIETIFLSKVSFRFLVLDSTKQSLESLVLHDSVEVEFEGITYTALVPVEISSEYESGMDLHNVIVTLSYSKKVSRESVIDDTITIL